MTTKNRTLYSAVDMRDATPLPVRPMIGFGMGGALITGGVIAPAAGAAVLPSMAIALAGVVGVVWGGYVLYRCYIDAAQQADGLGQSLKMARATNQRSANWIRRINEEH